MKAEDMAVTCADCWRNIASLTMSAVSSTFRAHFSEHSEKSAISLSFDGFASSNPGSLVISQVGNSVRPMHLFGRQPPQNALGRGLSLYPHISTRFHYAAVA